MRKIVLDAELNIIKLSDVCHSKPIFTKYNGKLTGMVIKDKSGWVIKTSADQHWNGHHETLESLIRSCHNLDFFTE